MDVYECLCDSVKNEYDTVRTLKESVRSVIRVVRNRRNGTRYVFRDYVGNADVYRRLLTISCSNLPNIYEAAEHDGRTAVMEEYVQGDTLAFLLEGGPLSKEQSRGIALQLCRALWVLHSLGAVHRDIKPENVIMRGDEAVLIDFDASRIYKLTNDSDTVVLGTTGYAAPEQYGITQSDGRADIYSLGVLINVMLTGKHPSRESAGGRLGRIIQKCTMTNPQQRYRDVEQLMDALG